MTDYRKYISALRKCAKEHENDRTLTGHIIVSDLCRDTANVLEALEQEPLTPKWCTDCREYDQEKHCCHRWSRAIRDTVEEMKQYYIEREVLDKIRAEIADLSDADAYGDYQQGFNFGLMRAAQILDKYKAESEK